MTVMFQSTEPTRSWYALGEVRRTAQETTRSLQVPESYIGWDGRPTGYFSVRFGRMVTARRGAGFVGTSVGVQHGFGFDRGSNVQVELSMR
jgi:hypothetical protein